MPRPAIPHPFRDPEHEAGCMCGDCLDLILDAKVYFENHQVLGRIKIVEREGETWIFHRSGKLLNYHRGV